jgi:hypothetical protein
VITRGRLAVLVVATGWALVSLLPWWQRRVEFSGPSGSGTDVYSADVWRASTPAALAVVAAAVLSIVLVANRGRLRLTRDQRGTGLVMAFVPVFLLGWAAWSIVRLTSAPKRYVLRAMPITDAQPFDGYDIVRDSLQVGNGEGPAWGLYVGVALVLVVTAWTSVRLLQSPKPE